MDNTAAKNTDRELWRGPDEGCGDYYADSLFVTQEGAIGMNVGGTVIVKPIREWFNLAIKKTAEQWLKEPEYEGCVILDPDGWRIPGASWNELITKEEFVKRFTNSTVMMTRPPRMEKK